MEFTTNIPQLFLEDAEEVDAGEEGMEDVDTEEEDVREVDTGEETNEPSYAYLLEKDKQRMCRNDLGYCARDQEGHPVPFCFEYPDDEGCLVNTHPPQFLFMGCYDDPTCGGKPLGKVVFRSNEPPYAYTADGKCARSSKLCAWAANRVPVPQCAKDQKDVAKCRDIEGDFLMGCYTEETCGGNVMPSNMVVARSPRLSASQKKQATASSSKPIHAYAVKKPNPPAKKKRATNKWWIVVLLLSVAIAAAVFYYHYRNKTPFWRSMALYFQKWKPKPHINQGPGRRR